MEVSNEIIQAARELGETLNASPVVAAFQQAERDVRSNEELCALEAEVMSLYNELTGRQQNGEVLSPQDINRFYTLRDRFARHPLVTRRDTAMNEVKALFEQVGTTISSILTMDYTALVLDEG